MRRNIILVIRDGWRMNPNPEYNAVKNANTPNTNLFLEKYPNTILESSGLAVGLSPGYQGSSEVGHLNMGAGRIVEQELKRINDAIENGSLFNNTNFQRPIKNVILNNLHMQLTPVTTIY